MPISISPLVKICFSIIPSFIRFVIQSKLNLILNNNLSLEICIYNTTKEANLK